MAEATQQRTLDEETRDLVDALARSLAAAQGSTSQRDLGPDTAATPAVPGATAVGEDQQRFFGSILQSIVTDVIPKVAPVVFGMLQQRRRELGIPEQRDADAVSRDFSSILGALLPKLLDAVPGIVTALQGRPAPRSVEEENERFLPFLAAVVPALISAAPSIIGLFNRQRGADGTPPPISDREVSERFIGPLLGSFIPPFLQAAPSILSSIFGGGRDVGAQAW
ncbi:hypothetical protein ACFCVO_00320 [Agromyces sp. NPDC056379]|uniref:hypothetical protein n=1 Tax=unclassified Agromyces TaxID=2639701 RepID=UPI0035D6B209